MAADSVMLHVRVDEDTKARATATLAAMGLSMSDAVRLFLRRVIADQAIPFEIKAPNVETRAAMAEAEEIVRTRNARFTDAEQIFADLEKTSGK